MKVYHSLKTTGCITTYYVGRSVGTGKLLNYFIQFYCMYIYWVFITLGGVQLQYMVVEYMVHLTTTENRGIHRNHHVELKD